MKSAQIPASAYLARPIVPTPPRRLHTWRVALRELAHDEPGIAGRALVALVIWCIGLSAIHAPNQTGATAAAGQANTTTQDVTVAASTTLPAGVTKAAVPTAARAVKLPSGPTGQLLPPGTMASDGTYANNTYAVGQCTWYVAGRRQIPEHWGDATYWYGHAVAAGWSVGTTPAVAAIAWVPRYGYQAGAAGHVALVEQVSADGTQVYLSEMNVRGRGIKSFRWAPADKFKYIY